MTPEEALERLEMFVASARESVRAQQLFSRLETRF
jgi:hypothetical protein